MRSDSSLKNTIIASQHLLVTLRRWFGAVRDDAGCWRSARAGKPAAQTPRDSRRRNGKSAQSEAKPLIFVSYATDDTLRGSHKFCGGEKLLNNLVVLLRRHGYEAWMVSTDGKHSDWLAEHAPFLSTSEFIAKRALSTDYRCVTSWIKARAFLDNCPRFYFWDQELGASSRSHFPDLARAMARGRIIRTAGVNRVVQAWHMAVFGREAALLRQLVDEKYWKPVPERKVPRRVGFFDEGDHTWSYIETIKRITRKAGIELEFHQLSGMEVEIIDQMQTCGVFLALNIGKSPWGEGGPMTPQEAMLCGTVPVGFDLKGIWEFVQQHYNGIVTEEIRPERMAEALCWIYSQSDRLSIMGDRCLKIAQAAHTMEARWPAVRRFLDLEQDV